MQKILKSTVFVTGLAMFSMFFGAGNVVFPLALGQASQDQTIFAVLGLLLSAVVVPFTGLISMILFNSDYKAFFGRIGKWPGFIVAVIIMGLLGPFGALPRCITLSYSSIMMFLPEGTMSITTFSILSCLLILFFAYKSSKILDILGYLLTPFLLISLGIIIVIGFLYAEPIPKSNLQPLTTFMKGFKEGYQTMDLIGALFFSSVILLGLRSDFYPKSSEEQRGLVSVAIKASFVGAFLLSLVYVCFTFLAAMMSQELVGVPKDQILGSIATKVLGPSAGIVTGSAVAMACLTTAIALASVFAHFLHKDILKNRLKYLPCLIITLMASAFISTFQFTGIVKLLAPLLAACYPALITLSIVNIFYKLYDFKPVKTIVIIIFLITLAAEYS